jgi:hypothetical protein
VRNLLKSYKRLASWCPVSTLVIAVEMKITFSRPIKNQMVKMAAQTPKALLVGKLIN